MAKPVPKKAATPAKKSAAPPAGAAKAPVKQAVAPVKAAPATATRATATKATSAAPSKAVATKAPVTKAPVTKAPAKAAPAKAPVPTAAAAKAPVAKAKPKVSAFDAKFLDAQRKLLLEERAKLLGQADHLDAEAAALMEDLDPGDVQFDDESGEGDTLVVERERDLALAGQARQTVAEIDAALARIGDRTYGLSVISGRPIPKERLRAIPWATELVEEKVGGLGTRR